MKENYLSIHSLENHDRIISTEILTLESLEVFEPVEFSLIRKIQNQIHFKRARKGHQSQIIEFSNKELNYLNIIKLVIIL